MYPVLSHIISQWNMSSKNWFNTKHEILVLRNKQYVILFQFSLHYKKKSEYDFAMNWTKPMLKFWSFKFKIDIKWLGKLQVTIDIKSNKTEKRT